MLHVLLALMLALVGCRKASDQDDQVPPTDDQAAAFLEASERLVGMLDSDGWLVSWWGYGTPEAEAEHQGDSLLFSSMAMGVLPCEKAEGIEAALITMLERTGGALYRHPSLPERVSLDGALGFWLGVAQRVARCPESRELWARGFALHRDFIAGGRLNPSDSATIPGVFYAVPDSVAQSLGLGHGPSRGEVLALADTVATWAAAVKIARKAAYRIHLGLISLQAVEASGVEVPGPGRDLFCGASNGADMPTIDHWCGRGDLAGWAESYVPDQYEYRHQRAQWESADGKPGLSTPGLDYLVAMRALYAPLPFQVTIPEQ